MWGGARAATLPSPQVSPVCWVKPKIVVHEATIHLCIFSGSETEHRRTPVVYVDIKRVINALRGDVGERRKVTQ